MQFQDNIAEDLIYPDRHYARYMQSYCDKFNKIFIPEVVAFGYERTMKDGSYMGVSNIPKLSELFIETKAFLETQDYILVMGNAGLCGFKYPGSKENSIRYNHFRVQLKKHFEINMSFYIVKEFANTLHSFVWSFKIPVENNPKDNMEYIILHNYVDNILAMTKLLNQFEKEFFPVIVRKNLCRVNIKEILSSC